MSKSAQFYVKVVAGLNSWTFGGSPGNNAIVGKPKGNCNDCSVEATIFANGDGMFTLTNNGDRVSSFEVTLMYSGPLGAWSDTSTVVVPPFGKKSVVRDVP